MTPTYQPNAYHSNSALNLNVSAREVYMSLLLTVQPGKISIGMHKNQSPSVYLNIKERTVFK